MAFTVTCDSAEGSAVQNYLRPSDAYQQARECEAKGISVTIDLPIISSAVYPKIRCAPGFHEVTTPFKSLLIIASSDDATRAAR